MGALSFLLQYIDKRQLGTDIFKFIPPMAAGFLGYAVLHIFPHAIKNTITWIIMICSVAATYFLFGKTWVIPALIVAGGIATNFSQTRFRQVEEKPRKIRWWNFWLFGIIFIAAGILSETARKNEWESRKPINLFENTYRMGSLVFGGGQVLMPLMYEQWSVRPEAVREKSECGPDRPGKIIHRDGNCAGGTRTRLFDCLLHGRDGIERYGNGDAGVGLSDRNDRHFFTQRPAGFILFPDLA